MNLKSRHDEDEHLIRSGELIVEKKEIFIFHVQHDLHNYINFRRDDFFAVS